MSEQVTVYIPTDNAEQAAEMARHLVGWCVSFQYAEPTRNSPHAFTVSHVDGDRLTSIFREVAALAPAAATTNDERRTSQEAGVGSHSTKAVEPAPIVSAPAAASQGGADSELDNLLGLSEEQVKDAWNHFKANHVQPSVLFSLAQHLSTCDACRKLFDATGSRKD